MPVYPGTPIRRRIVLALVGLFVCGTTQIQCLSTVRSKSHPCETLAKVDGRFQVELTPNGCVAVGRGITVQCEGSQHSITVVTTARIARGVSGEQIIADVLDPHAIVAHASEVIAGDADIPKIEEALRNPGETHHGHKFEVIQEATAAEPALIQITSRRFKMPWE